MSVRGSEETSPIELVLPGSSQHVRLARLMAGGIATLHGLSLTFVEDVRIAVDEVCATLLETGQGQPFKLEFSLQDDALVVTGTTRETSQPPADGRRVAISDRILDVLTETHQYVHAEGQVTFTVTIPLQDGQHPPE